MITLLNASSYDSIWKLVRHSAIFLYFIPNKKKWQTSTIKLSSSEDTQYENYALYERSVFPAYLFSVKEKTLFTELLSM